MKRCWSEGDGEVGMTGDSERWLRDKQQEKKGIGRGSVGFDGVV